WVIRHGLATHFDRRNPRFRREEVPKSNSLLQARRQSINIWEQDPPADVHPLEVRERLNKRISFELNCDLSQT
ncbi:MAG: hypothetical protein AAGA95_13905, partial [Pseudomonadota bacterium]